jgi:hypothetical protein
MPHDRRTRRVLLAMMGLIGMAMSVGCLRSSNLRSSPALPELSPAGELHPDPAGTTSPTPAAGRGSSGSDPMATQSGPALDLRPDPGESVASPPQGMPAPSLAPAATAGLATPAGASLPPGSNGATSGTGPDGGSSSTSAPAGDGPSPPATSPTPLLDAEIRRAQAVTRQHFESIEASSATQAVDPVPSPALQPAPAEIVEPKPTDRDVNLGPMLPPLAASARVEVELAPAESPPKITLPTFMPAQEADAGSVTPAPTPPERDGREEDRKPPAALAAAIAGAEANRRSASPPEQEPATADEPAGDRTGAGEAPLSPTQPDRTRRPPLEIADLRLCSRVRAFGSFEPIDPHTLKSGRRIRVYWEMAGLEYEPRGDLFVSRLAAHLELRSDSDGSVVWEQSPATAEDACPRRRLDYYASIPVELPATLEPGSYRLRLTQTDLLGNRTVSREVSVTIVR